MPAFTSVLKHEVRTWTATTLAILILVGFTNSNPVEPPNSVDQSSDSDVSSGSVPEALLARYYEIPYMEQEEANVAKRNPILKQISQRDIDEDNEVPRYLERRSSSVGGYWNLLKALEEELELEAMSREPLEADEPVATEVEPQNDVHKVNKRRRRYGFWATAINKMDKGHLKSFMGKHRNIYNVYKRQAPNKKWITPRVRVGSKTRLG